MSDAPGDSSDAPGDSSDARGDNNDAEFVITPGGPRRRDQVHYVSPRQAVRLDDEGNPIVVPSDEALSRDAEGGDDMPEDLVLTPGGFRPRLAVHKIEPGHAVDARDGILRKIHPSGEPVAELGRLAQRPLTKSLMPENVSLLPEAPAPGLG